MLTIAACIDARTFRHDRLEMGILIEQRFLSYMSVLLRFAACGPERFPALPSSEWPKLR
jgi:hypothetical protein